MKTINKFVEELNEGQLKEIARAKYTHMANDEVRMILIKLNMYVQTGNSLAMKDFFKDSYNMQKKKLQDLDLWNPKFDGVYQSALEGRLNHDDLYKVGVSLE